MLYLIPTPIGNLGDITLRAIETLKTVDLILCEDTRHSSPLMRHYEITTPLHSYEQFSEKTKLAWVIEKLKSGAKIALISDAGTPAVNDPGALLVKTCIDEGIFVTSLPGAASPIVAYSMLGTMKPFQFIGFFPKKEGEQKTLFSQIENYPGVTLFFESPHRIVETIGAIPFDCRITLFRELTKKFEERITGSKETVLAELKIRERLGEIVVALEPLEKPPEEKQAIAFAQELIKKYELSVNTASKIAADLYKVKKQLVYDQLVQDKN
ncbi:MAG: 16S rRNA (cytidine(1402)-2'-O)-methyltransferase [Chlamydiia bacterium]